VRNGLCTAKRSNELLGEAKGKAGYGNDKIRSVPERFLSKGTMQILFMKCFLKFSAPV